ncbi:MAG: FkbM family methyltransferase [Pyrinomonadaceae bacterium]
MGSDANSFLARVPPKHIDYPRNSWRTAEANGITLSLDISDLIGWYVYWGLTDAPRKRLYSLIEPGDCVIDIGANLGETALNAARLVGPDGRVFALEPFPANFELLSTNIGLNTFENITIINKAIGAENQILQMVVADENNAGMNRISDASSSESQKTTDVEVTKLDDLVTQLGIRKIDLIKVDVEGFEMNVLHGAASVLKAHRPKLFVEVIDTYLRRQGSSTAEVLALLESLDYRLTHANTGDRVSSRDKFEETQFDVVALPPDSLPKA